MPVTVTAKRVVKDMIVNDDLFERKIECGAERFQTSNKHTSQARSIYS